MALPQDRTTTWWGVVHRGALDDIEVFNTYEDGERAYAEHVLDGDHVHFVSWTTTTHFLTPPTKTACRQLLERDQRDPTRT